MKLPSQSSRLSRILKSGQFSLHRKEPRGSDDTTADAKEPVITDIVMKKRTKSPEDEFAIIEQDRNIFRPTPYQIELVAAKLGAQIQPARVMVK